MIRTSSASVLALSISLAIGMPAVARGETGEQLFARGADAMDRGAYAEACDLFGRSYAESHATGPLLGLAACNEAQGRYRAALSLFRDAEKALPADSPSMAVARAGVTRLEGRVGVSTVERPETAPPATHVEVDGKAAPTDGATIQLDPTVTHSVEVDAPGVAPHASNVSPGEGKHWTLVVAPESPRTNAIGPVRATGIALVTIGGLSVAAAALTGGILIARAQVIDENCAGANHTNCNDTAIRASESAHRIVPWNDAAWIVGAATIIAGIPMIVVGDRRSEKHPGPFAVVTLRGASVALEGTF